MIILAYISKMSQWHNYYKIYFSAMLTIYMSITIIYVSIRRKGTKSFSLILQKDIP